MRIVSFIVLLLQTLVVFAQFDTKDIHYYLPVEEYDTSITTPEDYLGYQVGEWHVSHDLLVKYMHLLSEESNRVSIETYGYSHEDRPLILLTITNETNQNNIDVIQKDHLSIVNQGETSTDINQLPVVLYQGYSIHGDEASGSNAALLTAYYLAASQSPFVQNLLKDVVILFDPCYNPDGVHRFSTWVNSHKSANLNPDEKSIEFHERWPTGRGNHYWFDLNRDWLLLTHPESKARITKYHQWYPNVLTDHHEMGKHSTFFFQPGVPERTNLLTPQRNQDLTEDISHYHAKHLDSIGSKYFSKERFDDYYYGKGSTYPDALGGIGILFEQAGVEGHLQETRNGLLSFPFAIRNQIVTSFSTWEASLDLKDTLMDYKVNFFNNAATEAKEDKVKGYQLTSKDPFVIQYLSDFLTNHTIAYSRSSDSTIVLSSKQAEYKLIKSMMEPTVDFPDSIFYDVSTWNVPMAFGLDCKYLYDNSELDVEPSKLSPLEPLELKTQNTYQCDQDLYASTQLVFGLLNNNIEVSYTTNKSHYVFTVTEDNKANISSVLSGLSSQVSLDQVSKPSGLTPINKPKIGMLIGNSANGYDAGAIWHQFDQRWNYQITLLDITRPSTANLDKYDIIIMPSNIRLMSPTLSEDLVSWMKAGGKMIGIKSAMDWAISQKITKLKAKKIIKKTNTDRQNGILSIGGSILNTTFNNNSIYQSGYDREIPVFHKGNTFYHEKKQKEAFLNYTNTPVASGFVSYDNLGIIEGAVAGSYTPVGKGSFINLMDNPLFRGYWLSGATLLANTLLLN